MIKPGVVHPHVVVSHDHSFQRVRSDCIYRSIGEFRAAMADHAAGFGLEQLKTPKLTLGQRNRADRRNLHRYAGSERIAAPALAIPRGSALDGIARDRLSTVYMPGRKITMLPDEAIARFTLAAGAPRPALSLYVETAPDGTPLRQATRLELVPVAANLRLDAVGEHFVAAASPGEPRWTDELRALWRLAEKLEAARGKPDVASPRLHLSGRLGRRARRQDRDRAATARIAAGQAGRRADDSRQQQLGEAACTKRTRPDCIGRNRRAR